jgi:hypothetical protein
MKTLPARFAQWSSACGLALLILSLLGTTGCGGYKLGPTNGAIAGARSIQVNFFQNKTLEPRLVEAVNNALRKNLQQDGTYRLATDNDGDIVVNGTITDFKRSPVGFQPADVLTVRDYLIFLTVHVRATERLTGKVVLDRDSYGRTTIRVGVDMASAERQAVPMLADDLAKRVTSMLVDGAW